MQNILTSIFNNKFGKIFLSLVKNQSNLLAVFLIVVLAMLFVPLPPFLLDLAFVLNFSLSIGIILVTMYVKEPLEFSTFPTVLLFVTLMRLALEISATRSILLNAYAGEVIHSVGKFVVGGNFVVGILIFIILFVVNFIVVTQGAGRVSEVAARFALDSMPGKQLAVDADLNAGIINEEQAKQRRKSIAHEADFYSTMDGGSKFVKGDAIASVVIAIINIVAGFIIGMLQLKMAMAEAASTYTLLTIGEGLASQIPALIVSVATGIIVTRANPELDLATDIGGQLFGRKEVIGVSAGAMLLLGLAIQGAFLPFTLVAVGLGTWVYFKIKNENQVNDDEMVMGPDGEMISKAEADNLDAEKQVKALSEENTPEGVMKFLKVDQIEVELGYKLVNLIDKAKGGDLMDRIGQIRKQTMLALGLPVPAIRVHDNLQVSSNEYQVKLRGAVIAKGTIEPDCFLAVDTGLVDEDSDPLEGKETVEPSYGLPAVWVSNEEKDRAEILGYTLASPSSVLATHLTEVIRSFANEILSRFDLVRMIEKIKEANESIVTEAQEALSTGELLAVLRALLREQVSIRDLPSIMEIALGYAKVNKDPDFLCERIREGLGRQICSEFLQEGSLNAITFHPTVEEELVNGVHMSRIALDPQKTKALLEQLQSSYDEMIDNSYPPVLLCSSKIRMPVRKILERALPQLSVISYNEVPTSIDAQSVAMIQF